MKKFILPLLTILIIAVASCTKEEDDNMEDEYKSNLTKSEWTMSTSSLITDTTTRHDYSNQPDEVSTIRKTTTVGTGTLTEETFRLQQEVGTTDVFQKETESYQFSRKYNFDEGGTYSAREYRQLVSYTYEETGLPVTTTPVTQPTGTSSESKSWSMKNVDNLKYILTFDLGALEIQSISENKLILTLNTSDSKTSVISPFETRTVDGSQTIHITMVR